jgi:hypothetical protein
LFDPQFMTGTPLKNEQPSKKAAKHCIVLSEGKYRQFRYALEARTAANCLSQTSASVAWLGRLGLAWSEPSQARDCLAWFLA